MEKEMEIFKLETRTDCSNGQNPIAGKPPTRKILFVEGIPKFSAFDPRPFVIQRLKSTKKVQVHSKWLFIDQRPVEETPVRKVKEELSSSVREQKDLETAKGLLRSPKLGFLVDANRVKDGLFASDGGRDQDFRLASNFEVAQEHFETAVHLDLKETEQESRKNGVVEVHLAVGRFVGAGIGFDGTEKSCKPLWDFQRNGELRPVVGGASNLGANLFEDFPNQIASFNGEDKRPGPRLSVDVENHGLVAIGIDRPLDVDGGRQANAGPEGNEGRHEVSSGTGHPDVVRMQCRGEGEFDTEGVGFRSGTDRVQKSNDLLDEGGFPRRKFGADLVPERRQSETIHVIPRGLGDFGVDRDLVSTARNFVFSCLLRLRNCFESGNLGGLVRIHVARQGRGGRKKSVAEKFRIFLSHLRQSGEYRFHHDGKFRFL